MKASYEMVCDIKACPYSEPRLYPESCVMEGVFAFTKDGERIAAAGSPRWSVGAYVYIYQHEFGFGYSVHVRAATFDNDLPSWWLRRGPVKAKPVRGLPTQAEALAFANKRLAAAAKREARKSLAAA